MDPEQILFIFVQLKYRNRSLFNNKLKILDPQNCLEGAAKAQAQVLHTVELSNLRYLTRLTLKRNHRENNFKIKKGK